MPRTLLQDGDTINFVTAGVVALGEVIEFTNMIGVALQAATASGQTIAVATRGVFSLAKETGVAFTQGQKVYWDAANNRVDATNTNIPCGYAWLAQASGDTVCQVRINEGASP